MALWRPRAQGKDFLITLGTWLQTLGCSPPEDCRGQRGREGKGKRDKRGRDCMEMDNDRGREASFRSPVLPRGTPGPGCLPTTHCPLSPRPLSPALQEGE